MATHNKETARVNFRNPREIRIVSVFLVLSLWLMLCASSFAAEADEMKRMRQYLGVLDTMITVAPLLGIFGTVIGIINSFDIIGATGVEHPQAVTAGIAQALITTASGLGVAILSVFPFNYFNSRVENAALAIEKYATSLEIVYEKLTGEC